MAFYKAIKIPIPIKLAAFPNWYSNMENHYIIQDAARASRVDATILEFAPIVKKATKPYILRIVG